MPIIGFLVEPSLTTGIFKLSHDLLAEICSYLLPKEVVHLAYTCQSMRMIFEHRDTDKCWERAQGNEDDFPARPPTMLQLEHARRTCCNQCKWCLEPYRPKSWREKVQMCKTCKRLTSNQREDLLELREEEREMHLNDRKKWQDYAKIRPLINAIGLGYWQSDYDNLSEHNLFLFSLITEAAKLPVNPDKDAVKPAIRAELRQLLIEQRRIARKEAFPKRLRLLRDWIVKAQARNRNGRMPSIWEFAMLPPLRGFIDAPPYENVFGKFKSLIVHLEKYAATWEGKIVQHLKCSIPKRYRRTEGLNPLDLAVGTFWRCNCCNRVLSYMKILEHACLVKSGKYTIDSYEECVETALTKYRISVQTSFKVSVRRLRKGRLKNTAQLVERFVKLFGLDPATATAEDMDNAQDRLVCPDPSCAEDGYRTVISWRAALCHYSTTNGSNTLGPEFWTPKLWRKATELEREIGLKNEASLCCPDHLEGEVVWWCDLCLAQKLEVGFPLMDKDTALEHVKKKHGSVLDTEEPIKAMGWHMLCYCSYKITPCKLENVVG